MSRFSALRYMISASLYFPFSKYLLPLSRYLFFATSGSRLHATTRHKTNTSTERNRCVIKLTLWVFITLHHGLRFSRNRPSTLHPIDSTVILLLLNSSVF